MRGGHHRRPGIERPVHVHAMADRRAVVGPPPAGDGHSASDVPPRRRRGASAIRPTSSWAARSRSPWRCSPSPSHRTVTGVTDLERHAVRRPSCGRRGRWCHQRRRRRAAAHRRRASGTPASRTGSPTVWIVRGCVASSTTGESVVNDQAHPGRHRDHRVHEDVGQLRAGPRRESSGQQTVGRTIEFERTPDLDGTTVERNITEQHAPERTPHHPRPVPGGFACRAPATRSCAHRTSTRSRPRACASPVTTHRPRRAHPGAPRSTRARTR